MESFLCSAIAFDSVARLSLHRIFNINIKCHSVSENVNVFSESIDSDQRDKNICRKKDIRKLDSRKRVR